MNSLATRLWVAWQVLRFRAVEVNYSWDDLGSTLSVVYMPTDEFRKRYHA